MDQTESTMEAPTLHRPTVRSAVLILNICPLATQIDKRERGNYVLK